jgi:hypothetical protein
VEELFGFAPIGRPRYLKGMTPILQLKKVHADSKKEEVTFTP